jgi:SHS2 domain-containing protein
MRLVAPTLEGLFTEAERALAEITLGESKLPPPAGDPEIVSLHSTDRDALLVDWIDELIFRTERTGKVYVEARFERLSDASLAAHIRGAAPRELRTVVKAATYHGLEIKEDKNGFSCTVVLDI